MTTVTFSDPDLDPTVVETDATGRRYFGLFSVDSDVLLTDGVGKPGDVGFFFLQIEDNIWAYNLSLPRNSFAGFRGPEPGCADSFCIGAPSPGFDVVNGEITNLRGGVFGQSDHPYVDFTRPGMNPNELAAAGSLDGFFPGAGIPFTMAGGTAQELRGSFGILHVPEPSSLVLFGFALVILAVMRKRSKLQL